MSDNNIMIYLIFLKTVKEHYEGLQILLYINIYL